MKLYTAKQSAVQYRLREEIVSLQFDTVIAEPDEGRLVLVLRWKVNVHDKVHEITQVSVKCSFTPTIFETDTTSIRNVFHPILCKTGEKQ